MCSSRIIRLQGDATESDKLSFYPNRVNLNEELISLVASAEVVGKRIWASARQVGYPFGQYHFKLKSTGA